jgi:hypothetical protein
MSGAAGGEIGVALVGAAIVAPIVAAAGVGYGIVKTTQFLANTADEAWERHERILEVRRREAALAEARHLVFREARSRYEEVRNLIIASGDLAAPPTAPDLAVDSPHDQLQQATAELTLEAERLARAHQSAAAVRVARLMTEAMRHDATSQAVAAAGELDRRAAELDAERRKSLSTAKATRAEEVAAAVEQARARALAARLARTDAQSRARVEELVAAIPTDLDADLAVRLQAWLLAADDLEPMQLERAVFELDEIVGLAQARAADRALHATLAAGIMTALAGCETAMADAIRTRARAYLDGTQQWDSGLPDAARTEVDRWTQDEIDLVSAATLAAALAQLGYEVGEAFVSEVADTGSVVSKDSQPDHAVAVQLRREGGRRRLAMAVVREGPAAETDAEREADVEAERDHCRDVAALAPALEELGVDLEMDYLEEPGSSPIGTTRRRERPPMEREVR